jgi:hypothetical protein
VKRATEAARSGSRRTLGIIATIDVVEDEANGIASACHRRREHANVRPLRARSCLDSSHSVAPRVELSGLFLSSCCGLSFRVERVTPSGGGRARGS